MTFDYSRLAASERAERTRRRWVLGLAGVVIFIIVVMLYVMARQAGYEQGYKDGRIGVPRREWF